MKYLIMYSHSNPEFNEFRDVCEKFAERYAVGCYGQGLCEYHGEFDDEIAKVITNHFKTEIDFTDIPCCFNGNIISRSEGFELVMQGKYTIGIYTETFNKDESN